MMENVMVIGTTAIIMILGIFLYIALAGVAIIYSMGADKSPKGIRIFYGILGVAMIYAFIRYVCLFA